MNRRILWGGYLVLFVVSELWALWGLPQQHAFTITDAAYCLFLVGIAGLAFNVRIISETLWRVVFGISVLFLVHTWLVMPVLYRRESLAWHQVALIQLFAIPALPLFLGLFLYAWRSPSVWRRAAQQDAAADATAELRR